MQSSKLTLSEWAPLAVSFIADLLTILAFVGVVATRAIRLAVGSSFAVLGLIVGIVILVRALRLWRSPEGDYYPSSYHWRRVGSSASVLLVATTLTGFVVALAVSAPSAHSKTRNVSTTNQESGTP